jgi:hypothetical protein
MGRMPASLMSRSRHRFGRPGVGCFAGLRAPGSPFRRLWRARPRVSPPAASAASRPARALPDACRDHDTHLAGPRQLWPPPGPKLPAFCSRSFAAARRGASGAARQILPLAVSAASGKNSNRTRRGHEASPGAPNSAPAIRIVPRQTYRSTSSEKMNCCGVRYVKIECVPSVRALVGMSPRRVNRFRTLTCAFHLDFVPKKATSRKV